MYKINQPYKPSKSLRIFWKVVFGFDAVVLATLIGIVLYYGSARFNHPHKTTADFQTFFYSNPLPIASN